MSPHSSASALRGDPSALLRSPAGGLLLLLFLLLLLGLLDLRDATEEVDKIWVLGRVAAGRGGEVDVLLIVEVLELTSAVLDGGSGATGAVPWAPPDPQREGHGRA